MRVYALLVGINDYRPSVGPLSGSVNDAKAWRDFLESRFDRSQLETELLLDSDATRANIIGGFRNFLARARSNDVVLFQYAGHGARWKAANEFGKWNASGYDEGLICHDSRATSDSWDLADKELAVLLSEVARNDPHIAVVLDSCHSGSGTRSADIVGPSVCRASHTMRQARPLDSYLEGYYERLYRKNEPLIGPSSRHILLAACERTGLAQENSTLQRGYFSLSIIEAMEKMGLETSYADLFRQTRILLRHRALKQHPQFETFGGFNAWSGLFNRLAKSRGKRVSVQYNFLSNEWEVDFGVVHGAPTQHRKKLEFNLFEDEKAEEPLHNVQVSRFGINKSVMSDSVLDLAVRHIYKAEITSVLPAKMPVHIGGDPDIVEQLVQSSKIQHVAFEWELESSAGLEYSVSATNDGIEITNLAEQRRVIHIQGVNAAARDYVLHVLNQIIYWHFIHDLNNPESIADTSSVEFGVVEKLHNPDLFLDDEEIVFDITQNERGDWSEVRLEFQASNKNSQNLNLMLVRLDERYGVQVLNNEAHGKEDNRFIFELTTNYGTGAAIEYFLDESDGNEFTHTFKLFVSRDKIDDFSFQQGAVEHFGKSVSLQDLNNSRGERIVSRAPEVEWFTKQITVTLRRQSASVGNEKSDLANGLIEIACHPALRAGASLLPASVGSRGVSDDGFVATLANDGFQLVNFSNSRGVGDNGQRQNVLELNNIENPETLKEHPLELQLNVTLSENESIVPIVFDGQHLLLAGEAWKDEQGKTQLRIDHLPRVSSGTRGVGSSLKMYFFKSVFGIGAGSQLVAYSLSGKGDVARVSSGLGERIHSAERVMLLVHGIYGSSQSMAEELARLSQLDNDVGDKIRSYDLILGFDYESINTPIEETARELKTLLKTKGLDEESGKKLTVVGHSMGGLVSRWLIEREGGGNLVDHLVMLGTPNEGSPFGTVGQAATAMNNVATMALNLLPSVARGWIQSAQKTLQERTLTTTLSQLATNSEFLKQLNSSEDPGVQYTVISGDINEYVESQGDERTKSLMEKMGSSEKFAKMFGGARHDIAVSMDSARAVLDSRSPAPVKHDVPCHHLNYMLGKPGLGTIKVTGIGVREQA